MRKKGNGHIYCSSCTREDYKLYRQMASFKLNNKDHGKLFKSDLIKKYGWYAPTNKPNTNLGGVSWDHLYRVSDAFENNIPIEIINHPANAEMVPHSVNVSRTKSMITLDVLYERIKIWEANEDLPYFYKE